jgi:PGF-pre-PGF domain-containing protein
MTTAISDMEIAYTDAAGRITDSSSEDTTELGAGDISGLTIAPGLHIWSTGVLINSGVTLSGTSTDVWIFQIAQDLTVGNGVIVTLSGGAKAENIFWQVAGQTTLGTTSQFKGIILCQTLVEMQTSSTLDGKALAQTAVTLDASTVSLSTAPTVPVLTTITLSPSSKDITINSTQQLTVDSLDQFGVHIDSTILYNSSNTSVATVNTTGFVTAITLGSSIITAYNGTVTNTSTINVVENVTEETVTNTSSSSGGGSNSITQTSTILKNLNGDYLLSFSKSALLIRSIELTTTAEKEDVKVSLVQKDNLLSNTFEIPIPQFEKLYGYIKVNHADLDSSLIQSAKIQFRVSKSWINKNNINVNQIVLSRFTSSWNNLETKIISNDSEYYYFKATSPGLSYFAIGTIKEASFVPLNEEVIIATEDTTPIEDTTDTETAITNTQGNNLPLTGNVIGENENAMGFWKIFLIVAIGITLISIIVYFSLISKKKPIHLK